MKHSIEEVFEVLSGEREYQHVRWPGHRHGVASYLTYMNDYLLEAQSITSRTDEIQARAMSTLRKFATLGVACMQDNGIVRRMNRTYMPGERDINVVFATVNEERDYQALMHPTREPGASNPLEIGEEFTLIRNFLRKADEMWASRRGDEAALECVRIVTACAVRCMQNHGAPPRVVDQPVMPELQEAAKQGFPGGQPPEAQDLAAAFHLASEQQEAEKTVVIPTVAAPDAFQTETGQGEQDDESQTEAGLVGSETNPLQ